MMLSISEKKKRYVEIVLRCFWVYFLLLDDGCVLRYMALLIAKPVCKLKRIPDTKCLRS
jgi:hypothetical protein